MKILIDTDWFAMIQDLAPDKRQEVINALLEYPNGHSDTQLWNKVIYPALEKGRIAYYNKISHLKNQKPQKTAENFLDTSNGTIVDTSIDTSNGTTIREDINNINNINNTKENIKRKSEEDLKQDFEELWKLYPRKRGKEKAYNAYKRAVKAGATNEEIRQGILNLIEDIRKNRTEERFIPYGSTFFNGKSWTDDMKTETNQRTCGDNKSQEFMDFEPF